MNKQILTYIITGIVLVGGLVFILSTKQSGSTAGDLTNSDTSQVSSFSGSMKDLVQRNQSLECTFSHDTPNSSSKGTVFVADGNVRGNFLITINTMGGSSLEAFMIADGVNSYVWSSLSKDGFKVALSESEKSGTNQGNDGINYNQNLQFSCKSWVKDVSVFIPPTDINFVVKSN